MTEFERKEWEMAGVDFDDETAEPWPSVPEATSLEELGEEKPARKPDWTGSTELFY